MVVMIMIATMLVVIHMTMMATKAIKKITFKLRMKTTNMIILTTMMVGLRSREEWGL